MSSEMYQSLCPGCFTEKGNVAVCPHCGYDERADRDPLLLKHRSTLHQGRYLIGRVLGKPGGQGIAYLGFDTRLERKVAIKEYFPDRCLRKKDHATVELRTSSKEEIKDFHDELDKFLKEARTLAKIKHANIVQVTDFFEENETGYLVMAYEEGLSLAEYLHQQGGKLTEKIALGIVIPILDGLREVHKIGILHRDIKPGNIYLTHESVPILLDFGAARAISRSERSMQLTKGLQTAGYSPFEQQQASGKQGPWTDVYASAATIYHLVTGECPVPAEDRVGEEDTLIQPEQYGVSQELSAVLCKAMSIFPKGRYQSIDEFKDLLWAHGNEKEIVQPEQVRTKPSGYSPNHSHTRSASTETKSQSSRMQDKDKDDTGRGRFALTSELQPDGGKNYLDQRPSGNFTFKLRKMTYRLQQMLDIEEKATDLPADRTVKFLKLSGALVFLTFSGFMLFWPELFWTGITLWLWEYVVSPIVGVVILFWLVGFIS